MAGIFSSLSLVLHTDYDALMFADLHSGELQCVFSIFERYELNRLCGMFSPPGCWCSCGVASWLVLQIGSQVLQYCIIALQSVIYCIMALEMSTRVLSCTRPIHSHSPVMMALRAEPQHGYRHVHIHLSYFIFREALKEDLGPKAPSDRWLNHIIVWRHSCQSLFITHGGLLLNISEQYISKRLFHF